MNLPEGWLEGIGSSPLILALLALVGATLVVFFLAPGFFNFLKKAKFPKRLNFVKRHPRRSLAAVVVILVAILFSVGLVIYLAQRVARESDEPPIVNPKGKAAFKYFPEGGNSPDFRDGSNGPLVVKMERKANQVTLSWDKGVKMSVVKVFDLGKIYKLKDQKLIWQITNYDPKNTAAFDPAKAAYLSSPYELGGKPAGFFLAARGQTLSLTKGARYTVELSGINEQGAPTLGVYTFTY